MNDGNTVAVTVEVCKFLVTAGTGLAGCKVRKISRKKTIAIATINQVISFLFLIYASLILSSGYNAEHRKGIPQPSLSRTVLRVSMNPCSDGSYIFSPLCSMPTGILEPRLVIWLLIA